MAATVRASLNIEVNCNCPNCDYPINLLDERDTGGVDLNEEGFILNQACPDAIWIDAHKHFSVEDVSCPECSTIFNVKELEW